MTARDLPPDNLPSAESRPAESHSEKSLADGSTRDPAEDRLTLRKELKGMSLLYAVFVVFALGLAGQCVERHPDTPGFPGATEGDAEGEASP